MSTKCSGVATAAATPSRLTHVVYRGGSCSATTIDGVLARLLFGLAIPYVTITERLTALDAIDGLIRLKIDTGLLRGRKR